MNNPQTVDRNRSHQNQARTLLWPVAVAVFLFTVSYPATDFVGASSSSDIGIGLFLVYAGIALVTAGVVFALVLPWALQAEPGHPITNTTRPDPTPDRPPPTSLDPFNRGQRSSGRSI